MVHFFRVVRVCNKSFYVEYHVRASWLAVLFHAETLRCTYDPVYISFFIFIIFLCLEFFSSCLYRWLLCDSVMPPKDSMTALLTIVCSHFRHPRFSSHLINKPRNWCSNNSCNRYLCRFFLPPFPFLFLIYIVVGSYWAFTHPYRFILIDMKF